MKNNNYLMIAGAVAVVLVLLYLMNSGMSGPVPYNEFYKNVEAEKKKESEKDSEEKEHMTTGYRYGSNQAGPYGGASEPMDESPMSSSQEGCPRNPQLTPEDLLPQDEASAWAKIHPEGSGSLSGKNYLQSGALVGIDTVGQTLRNANLQLRSEPPNPRVMVSPWLNSTIESDTNRRPFELGSC